MSEWKLVPVEPTREMLHEGAEARWRSPVRDANNVEYIYGAMLSASPPPPDVVGALERLAGMEAFTNSRMVDPDRDAELLARIDFARLILAQLKGEGA